MLHHEFFLRVLSDRFTVASMQEFQYTRDNTIMREYQIWDHALPDECVIMHVNFEGTWDDDHEERKRRMQVVTCVTMRSITADQATATKWEQMQMSVWEGMDKISVHGLPVRWIWQETGMESSLAANAIQKIMRKANNTYTPSMQPRATRPLNAGNGSRNLALILAVADYLDPGDKLQTPVRDGETLMKTLESLNAGWEVELVINPTRDKARDSLYAFFRKCEGVKGAVMVVLSGRVSQAYGTSHFYLRDSECSTEIKELFAECMSKIEVCDMLKWTRHRSGYPPTILVHDCWMKHLKPAPQEGRLRPDESDEFPNLTHIIFKNADNYARDSNAGRNSPFMAVFHRLIQTPGLDLHQIAMKLSAELKESGQVYVESFLAEPFFFDQQPPPAPPSL